MPLTYLDIEHVRACIESINKTLDSKGLDIPCPAADAMRHALDILEELALKLETHNAF